MTKPVGGRGKKAPYETMQMRVPVPVKPLLEAVIEKFRNGEQLPTNLNTGLRSNDPIKLNTSLKDREEDKDLIEDEEEDENEHSPALDRIHIKGYQDALTDARMLERENEALRAEIEKLKADKQKAIEILRPALKIPAGYGGQIKVAIREAFPELAKK